MNRREFRKRRVENDKQFLEIRRRECNAMERKTEYDMATRQKNTIMDIMKMTLKLVKIEIKELLEEKKK